MSVEIVTITQAVCTLCQAEIRRDCMLLRDIPPRRNFITWPRRRVECVCPNCLAVYRFTQRMEPGHDWQIENGPAHPVSDPEQRQKIRAKFPHIPYSG